MLQKKIATVLGLCAVSGVAMADLSANIGISSDYFVRGTTQTNHGAAVSGGLDYSNASGSYAGTWISNIADGTEIDLYAGYAGDMGSIGYDVGIIHYGYPITSGDIDAQEIYISGSWEFVNASLNINTDSDAGMYAAVGLSHDMAGLSWNLHNGTSLGAKKADGSDADSVTDTKLSAAKTIGDWDWGMNFSINSAVKNEKTDSIILQPSISLSRSFDL